MPYIGKSPVGGGFHKLDNLTASATATYALTLGSAAYYPETANQLLVSLNGVIQAPQDSFTVSGSNLVFDSALTTSDSIDFVVALGDVLGVGSVTDGAITKAKMGTTELDLATIKDSTGTNTAMTIDTAGDVTMSQASVDFWRLTANFSTDAADITGWERPDDGYNAYINGLSESSGVFTFTKTGLYKFDFVVQAQNASGGDGSFGVVGYVSTNSGSSYDQAALAYNGEIDTGTNNGASFQMLINVTDIGTFRVKFQASSLSSGTFISGNTDYNFTHFSCIKLAPAQ